MTLFSTPVVATHTRFVDRSSRRTPVAPQSKGESRLLLGRDSGRVASKVSVYSLPEEYTAWAMSLTAASSLARVSLRARTVVLSSRRTSGETWNPR